MIDKSEYRKLVEKMTPKSKTLPDVIKAYISGGIICCVGFLINELYMRLMSGELAGTMTSVTLVFMGVVLTATGVYDKIAKISGAGTLVPITGFANSMASPSIEFKSEGLILGLAAKMFSIAGPVIAYGISASIVYGVVYYIFKGCKNAVLF